MAIPTLVDVQAARDRLAGRIRRTPMMRAGPARRSLAPGAEITFKLEHLQISGSFKAHGALNKAVCMPPEALTRGLVTASGGNHGLGVAFATWQAGVPARIFLPTNTPESKVAKLKAWGAGVTLYGLDWFEANQDEEMQAGAEWLWFEYGIAAELSGAAAAAGLLCGRIAVKSGDRICVLVCGAGEDGVKIR